MKIFLKSNPPGYRRMLAMTLIEMMTALAIFLMALTGMFALHIFGLRYDQIIGSKLGAGDQSRQAFDKLLNDIRASQLLSIGTNYGGSNFVAVPNGQSLVGPAIQISFDTNFGYNLTNIVNYYFDSTGRLYRSTNGYANYKTMVSGLTNNPVFRGEDYQGNLLTTLDNHSVIGVTMQFYQYWYPETKVGSNYLFDFYQLSFKACSRDYN